MVNPKMPRPAILPPAYLLLRYEYCSMKTTKNTLRSSVPPRVHGDHRSAQHTEAKAKRMQRVR
jgi:hypothetical protein